MSCHCTSNDKKVNHGSFQLINSGSITEANHLCMLKVKVKTIILLYSVVGFKKLGCFDVSFSSDGTLLIKIILPAIKRRCPWYLKAQESKLHIA